MGQETPATAETKKELSEAIAAKYKLVGMNNGGELILSAAMGRKRIDLSTMTVEEADKLVEAGFKYLQPINATKPAVVTPKS